MSGPKARAVFSSISLAPLVAFRSSAILASSTMALGSGGAVLGAGGACALAVEQTKAGASANASAKTAKIFIGSSPSVVEQLRAYSGPAHSRGCGEKVKSV